MIRTLAMTIVASLLLISPAVAEITTIIATPDQVSDETLPRTNLGDAPDGFGVDSWQGPATGKSNWHARYLADGDNLSALFPSDAATLTIGDLASISYFTNRPVGTASGRDWWITIYTRPYDGEYAVKGPDDVSAWHHGKFANNYGAHTATGNWVEYSTASGMTFGGLTLDALKASYGTQLIESITVQTNSSWNGFDGYLDGLTISLTNGNVGRVNFEAVPEPGALALLSIGAFSMLVYGWRRRSV